MTEKYAKIAVSDVTYWVDRPYDYRVPADLADAVTPGVRVTVPFSRGNRKAEGVVLSVSAHSDYAAPKAVLSVLDEVPVLTEAQLKLALWMRERFFCTVYEAVKAMLPAGLWFQSDGKRKVNDKRSEWLRLAVPPEEAAELAERKAARAKMQSALLRLLSAVGEGSVNDPPPSARALRPARTGPPSARRSCFTGTCSAAPPTGTERPERPCPR